MMFQLLKTIFTALVSMSGSSDNDMDDLSIDIRGEVAEEEDEEHEAEEGVECNTYLVNDKDLAGIKVESIEGDKPGSTWLLVEDVYICHRYQGSEMETFWECSLRRKYNFPFKIGTYEEEEGSIKVSYMYKLECHDCGQTKLYRNSETL
jgi:hypothetical protein